MTAMENQIHMNNSCATNPVAGLLGDPREFSLEHRIFNSMMLIISITGVLGTTINIPGHLPFVQAMVTTQLIAAQPPLSECSAFLAPIG